jgi:hypothetical protein
MLLIVGMMMIVTTNNHSILLLMIRRRQNDDTTKKNDHENEAALCQGSVLWNLQPWSVLTKLHDHAFVDVDVGVMFSGNRRAGSASGGEDINSYLGMIGVCIGTPLICSQPKIENSYMFGIGMNIRGFYQTISTNGGYCWGRRS